MTEGIAPPPTATIDTTPAPGGQTHSVVRDERGIARGGIRLPRVAVPTALNTGENQPASKAPKNVVCGSLGTAIPFESEARKALYPTRDGYMRGSGGHSGRMSSENRATFRKVDLNFHDLRHEQEEIVGLDDLSYCD